MFPIVKKSPLGEWTNPGGTAIPGRSARNFSLLSLFPIVKKSPLGEWTNPGGTAAIPGRSRYIHIYGITLSFEG